MLGVSGTVWADDGQTGNVLKKHFVAAPCHREFIMQADHISGTEQE